VKGICVPGVSVSARFAKLGAVAVVVCVLGAVRQDGPQKKRIAPAAAGPVQQHAGSVVPFALDSLSFDSLRAETRLSVPAVSTGRGETIDLELERFEIFAPEARLVAAGVDGEVPLPPPPVVLFRGGAVGEPAPVAFLSVSPFGVYGWIRLEQSWMVISSGPPGSAGATVLFNPAELPAEAAEWFQVPLDVDDMLPVPGYEPEPVGEAESGRDVPCRLAKIALETDYEFTGILFGGSTDAAGAYAATLLGAVSDIYTRDTGVRLQISYLRLWPTPDDPWTQGNTVNQLYEFQNYWNANMTGIQRHAAHFLSGRPLGGGVAYYPGLCFTQWDYALSANLTGYFPYPLQHNHPQNWDPFVVAHELGHNFGAPHTHDMTPPVDGCAWGDCSVVPNGTIMSYCHTCAGGMTNIRMEFHPRTVNEGILPFLQNQAPCNLVIEPVTILQQPLSQSLPPGQNIVLSVSVAGSSPLSYQWRKGYQDLTDGGNISGATTNTLTISHATYTDTDVYDVVVANPCGPAFSEAAWVEVLLAGDVNCDEEVSFGDINAFILLMTDPDQWQATYPTCPPLNGDVSGDGTVSFADINPFVSLLIGS